MFQGSAGKAAAIENMTGLKVGAVNIKIAMNTTINKENYISCVTVTPLIF